MDLSKLSFTKLCVQYLEGCRDNERSETSFFDDALYYKELKSRLDVEVDSFEELINEAKNNGLISDQECRDIFIVMRIKKATCKALGKLKKDG